MMEQPSDAEAEAAAAPWEELLEEIVIKHERGSERQLYVYGISAHRCPQCRSRIKPSSRQCEACRFTHNVELKCRRCMGEAIAMWCYECDAHYCVGCYSRPHVLSLSASGVQHSCFPIENSSGKCLVKGSWNQDFDAVARSLYRLRISESLTAGAAGPPATAAQSIDSTPDSTTQAARAGEQQTPEKSTVANRPEPTPTSSTSTHSAPDESHIQLIQLTASGPRPSSTDSAVDEGRHDEASSTDVRITPVSLPSSSSASLRDVNSSTPTATVPGAESRKRQLNGNGHDANAKQPRTERHTGPPAHHQASQALAPSSPPVAELSLYEQVRLMHEKRKQKPGLPPRPYSAPQHQLSEHQPSKSTQPSSEQRRDDRHSPAAQVTPSTPQTNSDAEHAPSPLAPATNPLGADHAQRIAHELEQQQQLLQRAVSSSPVRSSSTFFSVQDTDDSRPRTQATYPAQHVESPLPSPLPSPARPSGFSQSFGGPGVGLAAAPPHAASAVGFVRPGASASHLFQPVPTALVDLTAPMGPTHSFLQPQPIGSSTPAMAFQSFHSPAGAAPLAGDLTDEDVLLSAVLVDFNAINVHVMELESTIQSMMSAVRMFSFQDVAKASALNAKIAEHRRVLELARARRIQISARVMMYLPAVIEFVRSAERNSWGDVPRVLMTCQARLAQLAGDMSSCEERVLQLRSLIDEAVSSNDMRRIMQVQELGDQLKQEETRLDGLKTERDSQFVLMIKFSRELRKAVQLEVAALSRSAEAASGSASSA